jgi:hypothetical protein
MNIQTLRNFWNSFMLSIRIALSVVALALVSACGGGGGSGAAANNSAIIGLTLDNAATPTKLVVANADNQTIQTLTLSTNAVATLAGTPNTAGTADGTGTAAKFYEPFGITLSGLDYFVADTYNNTIRKLTSAGVVTTIAGTAGTAGSADGTGSAALFYGPKSLVSDGTNLYVNDTTNHTIRKVVIGTGVTTTLAGYAGTSGTTDGTGSVARFYAPFGIAYDGTNLFVTDTGNQTIRKVTAAGVVTTLAGTAGTSGTTDATGTAAKFNNPADVVSDGTNLFVVDSSNHTIRKIVIATGVVTTLVGTAGNPGSADGTGAAARFNTPIGMTIDNAGNLYVSDQNYTKIRKIVTSTGVVTTISATF